jgi:nitrogen fixation NifU-like protein
VKKGQLSNLLLKQNNTLQKVFFLDLVYNIYYNNKHEKGDSMDNNLKRSIILEHYQHPVKKGLIDDDSYIKINMNNESCIDEINLMVKIKDDVIVDMRFDGEACAICTSATSIMIDTLIGKNINQAIEILNNYYNMIDEKEYNQDILEQAIVYEDIYKQPNRKKCALLPWWGIERVLNKYRSE